MQKQPRLPYRLVYSPIALPDDFPIVGDDGDEQGDAPITYLHRHQCLEFGYCYEGNGVFVVGEKVLPFHAGDVSVIASTEVHLAQSLSGTRSRWVWIYLDPIRLLPNLAAGGEAAVLGSDRLCGPRFGNLIAKERDPLLGTLVREIAAELRHRGPGHRTAVRGLVAHAMARLQRLAPKRKPAAASGSEAALRRIAPALHFMTESYRRPTSVGDWAKRCHCSVTHFRRLFAAALGKLPHQYMTELRVRMAATRLHSSEDKVIDVALGSGFASLSSFNRSFRALMGCSPRAWRKKGPASADQ